MTFVAKFKIKEQDTIKAKFTLDFKPSKVSQLENDLHFQTDEEVASTVQTAAEEITIETDAKITEVNQTINNLSQTVEGNYLDLDNKITVNHQELDNHTSNRDNPHEVTKAQIGLGNVDNTSDLNKPISTATQTALDTKVDKTSTANRVYGTDENGNQTTYSYETFGKVNDVRVDGISVVTDKIANLGSMANENSNDYSTTIEANSLYAEKSLETTVSNHISNKNNPHEVTKTQIGLGNVDNTSDLNKPISNAVQTELSSLSNSISSNYTSLNNRITEETATLNTAITTENTQRQSADNNLQFQIDAITSASDVTDIVGTYAQLQAYDTSALPPNSIIKVLQDEHQNNETTYYRWVVTGDVGSWVLIGEEGPYYTKSEADGRFTPQTRTINSKPLSTNVVLTANDVNALPNTTVIGDGVLSVQKNGTTIDTFSANSTENKVINIAVPTDTSDLTNNAGFITSEDLPMVNNGTLTIQVNGSPVGTFTANQSSNTTANIVVPDSATWGNITGDIEDQTDLQDALDAKQDTLVAGTDLEIIKGSSTHNLPEGYTEVEYIQANGNAGIITSVAGNINTNVTLIANCTQILTTSQVLISDGYDGNGGTYFGQPSTKSTWGAGANGSQITSLNVLIKTEFNISSTVTTTLSLNGTVAQGPVIQTFSRAGTVSTTGNYTNWSLFGSIYKNNNTIAYPTYGKIYYAKFEQNNTVVAEYIPAIRNSDNAVGLYDIINNTFIARNLGTGTLIAGEKVADTATINFTNESGYALQSDVNNALALKQDILTAGTGIDITNNVISNTQTSAEWGNITGTLSNQTDLQDALDTKQDVLTAGTDLEIIQGTSVKLPEGFTQLEYIQFTGTQYINTGILGNAGIETDVTFSFDEVPRDNSVLASRVGQTRIYPIHIYNGWCLGYSSYYSTANIPVVDVVYNVVTALKAGQQTMTVNNYLAINRTDDTVYNTDIPLYLGAQANATSAGDTITAQGFVKIKLYRIKIKSNGVLVLDGVPCDNNGTIGLYDLVSETLLTNQGTGALIAGAEVPSSTVINFTNETGYITGIDSTDVANALGYTPVNPSSLATVATSGNYDDLIGKPYIPSGVVVDQTFDSTSQNAQSGVAIAGAGFLTSSSLNGYATQSWVTSQGYTTNTGTVTSVNNVQPVNGNVTIPIPTVPTNISAFTNDSGYITASTLNGYATQIWVNEQGFITSADLPTLEDLTTQAQMNAINSGATSVNIAQIASNTQAISTETLNRQNADNGLQSQIDAIVASSDVFDIVGTYAELQAYDISTVPPNDIIKVLVDSTHNNAATYYRCVETGGVKSWSYIGSEGAYYTKSEADGRFVPLERTINGKALSSNITLDASDVGALPSSTVIPTVNNGTLDIQVNGTSVGTFTANQSSNTTANIVVPNSATWGNITGDIADQTDLQDALDAKQDTLVAGTDLEIVVGSGASNTVSGTNSIILSNAAANSLSSVIVYGKCSQTGTPTTSNPVDIVCNNGAIKYNTSTSSFYTDGTVETVTDSLNNTATAEMLLGFGDYIDTQDLLGVGGTRKVGLMVLTGTEEFDTTTLTNCYSLTSALENVNLTDRTVYCTHFQHASALPAAGSRQGYALIGNRTNPLAYTVGFGATTQFSTVALFKSWLATQYANGTPVIIAYPLATPTTFGATAQTLNTKSGSNQLTITQSAISNLSIKATYTTDSTSTINFTNESGYITGINSTDVTTALGYTPVNASSLATVATSGDYDDLTNKPTIPTVGDGTITITQGGVTKGTFTTNQSGNSTIALDAGGGGGTSYNAGLGIDITNDTISIDTSVVAQLTDIPSLTGYATETWVTSQGYLTSSALTNYVTTDTAQDISGRKTFLGEKAIYFKQNATSNKLGFTLYNPSSTELGAFEYRPNTISGGALLNVNCSHSSSDYVGFRYWGTAVNIIAPKVATAGDYYIPVNITDGNTTVTANSSGTVDISSLLPNVSGYLENTATGSNSLSIFGSDATYNDAINIGYMSEATGYHSVTIGGASYDAYYPEAGNFSVAIGNGAIAKPNSVAIGYEAHCYNNTNNSIAIGYQASVSESDNNTTTYAIQLGEGENTTSNTMQVWDYPLLDKTTGLIPDARLSSNIARTSQIPTVPTNVSAFTNDSGYITSSALSGYATETWVGQQGFITSASLPTMTYTSATETLTFG